MINKLKQNIFNLIAIAILATFIGVWGYIMQEVVDFQPTGDQTQVQLPSGVVELAGLLGVTIATITASALGFTIAEVKRTKSSNFNARTVGEEISTPTLLAILAYIGVAIGAFFVWVANEESSPEVLSVFAMSAIGWLVGSASVAFKTTAES